MQECIWEQPDEPPEEHCLVSPAPSWQAPGGLLSPERWKNEEHFTLRQSWAWAHLVTFSARISVDQFVGVSRSEFLGKSIRNFFVRQALHNSGIYKLNAKHLKEEHWAELWYDQKTNLSRWELSISPAEHQYQPQSVWSVLARRSRPSSQELSDCWRRKSRHWK